MWFVNRQFFAFLDEAIGNAPGQLDLHFQFAPGEVIFDEAGKRAFTQFDDANVLVTTNCAASVIEEEGWFAWTYGSRVPRKAFRFALEDQAPTAFLTVVAPYRGTRIPAVSAELPRAFRAGDDRVELTVDFEGKTWCLGRELSSGEAWMY